MADKMDEAMLAALKARRAKFSADTKQAIADLHLAVALHEAMADPLTEAKTIDEFEARLHSE